VVQLKDDCFAFGDTLVPLDQALEDLRARVSTVVGVQDCDLDECLNRVLAQDIAMFPPMITAPSMVTRFIMMI